MSNFAFDLYSALSVNDDSYRSSFDSDVSATMAGGLGLMTYTTGMATQLMTDRINMVSASMNPDPGSQMLANADQIIYNNDSAKKDMQTNAMQQGLKLKQSSINSDNQNRQANFSSAEGISSFFGAETNMFKTKF
jgi:hypothetical protein